MHQKTMMTLKANTKITNTLALAHKIRPV